MKEETMTKTATYLAKAQDAFEAGFASKAAQKRAMDDLNCAYRYEREALMKTILAARTPETAEQNHADYWAVFADLHQVRERHFEIAARYADTFGIVREMIALRAAIKDAEIIAAPRNESAAKVEAIRKTITEEMERRKAQYIEALEIGRHFGGLPVSVNAHWVHGHKGTVFLRHFFYLRGKLTPLNLIMAAAEQLEREDQAAA